MWPETTVCSDQPKPWSRSHNADQILGCRQDIDPYSGILPDKALIGTCQSQYGLDLDVIFMSPPPMGGDLWGLLPIDANRLGIFCADVCGHGNSVAPHTRLVHTLLHMQPHNLASPDQVLSELNRNLYRLLPRGRFAAMFYGVIDFARDQLVYACSAFMPQLCRTDKTEKYACLVGEGLPLGFLSEAEYDLQSCRFGPGAGLTLYSDALVETPAAPHSIFTPEALCRLLNETSADKSARAINACLINRLNLMEHPLQDDLTLITLFRKA